MSDSGHVTSLGAAGVEWRMTAVRQLRLLLPLFVLLFLLLFLVKLLLYLMLILLII